MCVCENRIRPQTTAEALVEFAFISLLSANIFIHHINLIFFTFHLESFLSSEHLQLNRMYCFHTLRVLSCLIIIAVFICVSAACCANTLILFSRPDLILRRGGLRPTRSYPSKTTQRLCLFPTTTNDYEIKCQNKKRFIKEKKHYKKGTSAVKLLKKQQQENKMWRLEPLASGYVMRNTYHDVILSSFCQAFCTFLLRFNLEC